MPKINRYLILIIALAAFLYFFQLGAPSVWDQDEGQMLASALEMVKSGDFLTPHLNSAVYFHKPPLYAWLTAMLFKLFGFTEFWGRLSAAVFGIAGVCLTYLFARRIYNERTGLLSALILAVSPLYIVLSKMALVDVVLTFFITLALYFFYVNYSNPNDKRSLYLMYLAMGLATMTKGPLGLIVPFAAILLFLLIDKKLSFIKSMELVKGAILYLLVASPWFIIETVRHGTYFLKIIFGQFLFTIYMSPLQQHPGPFYYYLIVILVGFLPWSGFFIASLFKKPHALLLSLTIIMLAIFSTASTKVPGYFLPAFPAMAIIAGSFLDRVFSGQNKLGFYVGVILPIILLSVTSWAIMQVSVPAQFAQAVLYLQTLLLLTLTGFFLSFLFSFLKPQPAWTTTGFAASVVMLIVGLTAWLLPYAENFKPSNDLALALKGREHVAFYRTWLPPSLIFYLNRQTYPVVCIDLQKESELLRFLRQRKAACYIAQDEAKKLRFSYRTLKAKAQYAIIARGE